MKNLTLHVQGQSTATDSLDQSCLMLQSQGVTGGCESSGNSGINIEITAAPAVCDKYTLLLSVIASKCHR